MDTYTGGRGKKATFSGIDLSTLEKSRETFAEVIKQYGEGEISESMGRALTYMLGAYLQYWKLEKELEIEKEIQEIKKALEARFETE